MRAQLSSLTVFNPLLNTRWLPPLISSSITTTWECMQGWCQQAKESVWYAFNEPKEPFFVRAQKNEHFVRFQAWRAALKRDLRVIRTKILSGELNAVKLGERLLVAQKPDQMAEHILSPVMYSWLLTQLEQDLRKQAEASGAHHKIGVDSQTITFTANVIRKALQQLRSNLVNSHHNGAIAISA